jgi:hypothetical protein
MNMIFKWKISSLGGGGYITGFLQNPQHPEIFYARCDVSACLVPFIKARMEARTGERFVQMLIFM